MKLKKIFGSLLIFLLMIFSMTACNLFVKKGESLPPPEIDTNWPTEILGETIEAQPRRVVSMSPGITKIMYEMGTHEQIVGRSTFCSYPKAVSELTDCGTAMAPNIEEIAALKADYIITQMPFMAHHKTRLSELGIRIIEIPSASTSTGIAENYRLIYKFAMGGENGAKLGEQFANEFLGRLEAIKAESSAARKSEIKAIAVLGKEDIIAGSDTFIAEVMGILGTKNISAENVQLSYDVKNISGDNPDVIFVSGEINISDLRKNENYKNTNAVKNNRVYPIDMQVFDMQTPDIIKEIHLLAKMIYGDDFTLSYEDILKII